MARLTYVNDFVTYLVLTYVKSRVTCAACFKLNHVPLTRGGSSVPQTRGGPQRRMSLATWHGALLRHCKSYKELVTSLVF